MTKLHHIDFRSEVGTTADPLIPAILFLVVVIIVVIITLLLH